MNILDSILYAPLIRGAKTAFKNSLIYGAGYAFIESLFPFLFVDTGAVFFFGFAFFSLINFAPLVLWIGYFTTSFILNFQYWNHEKMTQRNSELLGGAICLAVILMLHIPFFIGHLQPSGTYLVILGLPSLIYVFWGIQESKKIFQEREFLDIPSLGYVYTISIVGILTVCLMLYIEYLSG